MAIILMLAGILFIFYFLCIEFFTGHGTNFYLIWLFLGIVSLLWGMGIKAGIFQNLPIWMKRGTGIVFTIGITGFLLVQAMIVSGFFAREQKNLDYIIVLGAQLKENGPSKVLQMRLDRAYTYLLENPETLAIVSGGQGSNEPDTEAQGMYDYLVRKGIPSGRILKEDKSANTTQNITFSSTFLNKEKDRVGIVTNNFHVFRAKRIAKTLGFKHIYGIPAPSYLFLQPNNMFREFFGVAKDFLMGNM